MALFEIVNKHMSLQARSGDMEAFKTDVDQAVITKGGQLDGTVALLRRDPQPPASPLQKPAGKVFPIVVCGGHFPVNPVTRNYVKECLQDKGKLQAPGVQPLAIIDLDELESCVSLAKAGVVLPELLANWLTSPSYGKGSLTLYLWANYGGNPMERPAHVAATCERRSKRSSPCSISTRTAMSAQAAGSAQRRRHQALDEDQQNLSASFRVAKAQARAPAPLKQTCSRSSSGRGHQMASTRVWPCMSMAGHAGSAIGTRPVLDHAAGRPSR